MDLDRYLSPRLRKVLSVFGIVAGLAGVFVQILTAPSSIRSVSTVILFAVAGLLVVFIAVPEIFRLWRAGRSLPAAEDIEKIGAAYRVEDAMPEDIGWIAQLEASVYSEQDAVPELILREWYEANPTGFFLVKSREGSRVGHINILPLRPSTLQLFLDGTIVEREIRGDSIHPPAERESIEHLYVESIILRPSQGRSTAAAMIAVLSNTGRMLTRVANLRSVEAIYAIAATGPGERLLRRLGFDLLKPAQGRRDVHNLFCGRPALVAKRVLEVCGRAVFDEPVPTELAQHGLKRDTE